MTWVDYLPYIFTGAGAVMFLAALWAWVSVAVARDMRREDERRVEEWNRRPLTATERADQELREAEMRESWRPYFSNRWEL
jgi:hypothetical protein